MTEDNERDVTMTHPEQTHTGNQQTTAASLLDEYRKALATPPEAPDAPPSEEQLAFERKLAGYRARRAAIMGRV